MVTETKNKNWFRRHWIISIILGFIVLGMIGSIFDSGEENKGIAGNVVESEEENQEVIYKVGETFMVDDISYTIKSIETTETLSGFFSIKEAGGIFYIISVTAENEGKEPREYFTPHFEITDNQGREFSDDREASSYATEYGKELSFEQLQPGLSKSGIVIFDLPKDSTGLQLRVKNDIWGLFDAYVDLGI